MKNLICFVVLMAAPLAPAAEEWTTLFDGKTLAGWKVQNNGNWRVEDGAIVVDKGDIGLLTTEQTWKNYELEVEFRAQVGCNSGIFLNTKSEAGDVSKDCYEVNIAPPENPFPTGSIVQRKLYQGAGEKAEWQKYRMILENGHVRVWLDGKATADYQDESPVVSGFIGLQMNEGKVEFRNIRIRKLP